ncbi:MAG: HlyD family efflux transporter periplasmic adaptor subunit, partial [Lentisphaeraceae bacterium]|nr:HlyD family efflux transporter periplasmic adaptor subunit [Lentisphaeraceae bacterium]
DAQRILIHPFDDHFSLNSTKKQYLVFMPVKVGSIGLGLEVYHFATSTMADLSPLLERLQMLMPYFDFYEGRIQLKDYQGRTERLHQACEVLIKLNQSSNFLEGAMHLCNEMAARYSCSRVSLGVLKGRYICLKTISNTEKFKRKVKILQDIEKVMEESLDQNLEVQFPQSGKGDCVARAAAKYSQSHGPLSILSLPLRSDGQVKAVLTFEREHERPFSNEEVEVFRLVADLFSPRLLHLHHFERWFGARTLDSMKRTSAFFIGAKYTWLKLGLITLVAAGVWLSQAEGTYQVEASFTFNSQKQRMLVVPFDAEIEKIMVRNGDLVKAGQQLLVLDTTEQKLKLDSLLAQKLEALKQVSVAMNEGKTAEAQIAQAEADQATAEIKLINYNIKRAVLKAPINGTILTDDLHKRLYSLAQFGENILEVMQTEHLEANLFVPEEQIADVFIKGRGALAAAGYPDRKVPFSVMEIKRVAEVANQRNVFKVKVKLEPQDQQAFLKWARPGMEGVARIDVD